MELWMLLPILAVLAAVVWGVRKFILRSKVDTAPAVGPPDELAPDDDPDEDLLVKVDKVEAAIKSLPPPAEASPAVQPPEAEAWRRVRGPRDTRDPLTESRANVEVRGLPEHFELIETGIKPYPAVISRYLHRRGLPRPGSKPAIMADDPATMYAAFQVDRPIIGFTGRPHRERFETVALAPGSKMDPSVSVLQPQGGGTVTHDGHFWVAVRLMWGLRTRAAALHGEPFAVTLHLVVTGARICNNRKAISDAIFERKKGRRVLIPSPTYETGPEGTFEVTFRFPAKA